MTVVVGKVTVLFAVLVLGRFRMVVFFFFAMETGEIGFVVGVALAG